MRVVYGNLYNSNRRRARARRRMFKGRPDIAITVESGWLAPLAPRIKGYRPALARGGASRGRTDVVVWVKRRHEYLGEIALRTTPAMGYSPAAHDRYVIAALARVDGVKVAAIGWHPNPAPAALRGTDSDHPLVEQHLAAFAEVLALARYLRRRGFRVVLGADAQVPVGLDRDWAPAPRLRASGLPVSVSSGIDLLAADQQLETVDARIYALPADTGADHPWLTATYRDRWQGARA